MQTRDPRKQARKDQETIDAICRKLDGIPDRRIDRRRQKKAEMLRRVWFPKSV